MNQAASILVVDNVAANRALIFELLKTENYRIIEAGDGPTALRLAIEHPPDLVLLDVMMPGMDGFTVCRLIRADARIAEVPVIMITALENSASRLEGIQAGADDFITQPFNRDELRARVRTITRLNRYRRLVDAQAALHASETRFRELAENIQDVFWVADPEKNRKQYISPAYEKIWGRTCQSAYDSPHAWIDSIHPEDRDRVRHAAEIKQISGMYDEEFRILRPDGTERWVHDRSFPVHDPNGGVKCWAGVSRDITGSKRAEEALQRSAAEFRALAEAMPHMVWITRPDGWSTYFSQQWMDYTGLTLKESLGHGWNRPFHPEDQQRAWDAWQYATATGGVYSIESRLRRADGVYRWWLIRGVPQVDATGNILKWFGTCTDVHDLKVAELEISRTNLELRESEEKFLQLAANVTDVFYITSPDLREMLYVSPAYERIWGRTTESLYAHPYQWGEAILPEERANVIAAFSRLAEGVPSLAVEFQIARPDGSVRWILSRGFLVRDAAGKGIRITGIASDITERKLSECALRESEERARSYFGLELIGMAITSPTQGCIEINDRFCEILGYERSELLQMSWAQFTHPDDLPADLAHFDRVIAGECDGYSMDKRFIRKDGQVVQATISVKCVRRADGTVDYFAALLQDITERKLSEAALEEANKQLMETSRLSGMAEVATSVLHNVGNVLNSVNVASNCLVDSIRKSKGANLAKVVAMLREHEGDLDAFLETDSKGKQLLGYLEQLASHLTDEQTSTLKELAGLHKNVEHIKEIVSMQQSFAKVSGRMEKVMVTDLVEDALKMNSSSFGNHDIQVVKEFENVPLITVERHKALQILVNLVRNATQACDEAEPPEKRLTLRVTNGNERILISVSDNGIGIPSENITRIFSHGFTTKISGHGFGLHNCAIVAKVLGGSLSVKSDGLRQGATFTLQLPLGLGVKAPQES